MKKTHILNVACLAFLFFASSSWAGNAYRYPIQATQKANAFLMTNPPLPQSFNEKGTHKISVMPAYIKGTANYLDHSPSGDFNQLGEYSGFGGGAAASWAFADKWAVWGFALGTTLNEGSFSYNGAACTSNGCGDQETVSNFSATVFTLAGGLSWQFKGEAPTDTTWTLFFGPSLMKADIKESYLSKRHPQDTSNPGQTIFDLDIKTAPLFLGFAVGTMASISVFENWKLEPFAIISMTFGNCHEYEVENIRTNNPISNSNNNLTGTGCNDNGQAVTSPHEIEYDTTMYAIGLNVKYKPWDIGLNITAPFLQKALTYSGENPKGNEVTVFTFTKSFGDYKQ